MSDRYCYLMMVDFRDNHNKFYEITETANGLDVKYGRVGETVRTHHYDPWEKSFNALYSEKTAKGYKDVTNLHTETKKGEGFKPEPYADNDKLAKELYEARRRLINDHYLRPADINENMIYSARECISQLEDCVLQKRPAWRFNEVLEELCHIAPRKTIYSDKVTRTEEEMLRIIDKEKTLLDAIESDLKSRKIAEVSSGKSLFEGLNLEVRPCTYAEEDEILSLMNRSVDKSECVTHAYRIVNRTTTEAYEKCKKDMHIPDAGCRLLFHGSGNGNWLSIMEHGLLLDPKAKITAKGLGHGLYFADDVVKSLNYNSDPSKRYVGIYEVATGKEWNTGGNYIGHDPHYGPRFSFRDLRDGCQSVFLEGKRIRPGHLNEYCVYKQEQANIKYLICCERERTKDVRFSMHLHLPFENMECDGNTITATAVLSDYAKDRLGKIADKPETASAQYNIGTSEFTFTVNGNTVKLTKDEEDRIFRDFKKSFFESERDFDDFCKHPDREIEKDEVDQER